MTQASFDVPAGSPLSAVHAEILKDLEARQGPWRRRPLIVRLLMAGLPGLAVIAVAWFALPPSRDIGVPIVGAGVAALLAFLGVALAPERPAVGERLSQLATVVAVIAFAAELSRAGPPGSMGTTGCLATTGAVTVVALLASCGGLWSSGLPLRPWHRIGLAVAVTLGACAAAWHHCMSDQVVHVLFAHGVGPVLLAGGVALGVGALWRRFHKAA